MQTMIVMRRVLGIVESIQLISARTVLESKECPIPHATVRS